MNEEDVPKESYIMDSDEEDGLDVNDHSDDWIQNIGDINTVVHLTSTEMYYIKVNDKSQSGI